MTGHMIGKDGSKTVKKSQPQINHALSIKDVIKGIKTNFPQSMKHLNESDFVAQSRVFVMSLASDQEKLNGILQMIPKKCEYCLVELVDWKHKVFQP